MYQPGVADPVVGRPLENVGRAAPGTTTWHRKDGEIGPLVTVDLPPDAEQRPVRALLACQGEVVGAAAIGADQPLQGLQVFVTEPGCAPEDLHLSVLDADGARVDAGSSA